MHGSGGILQVLHFRRSDNENVWAAFRHINTIAFRRISANICLVGYAQATRKSLSPLLLSMCKQRAFFYFCHHSRSRLPKRFLKNGNIIRVRIKIFFPVPKECIFTSFAVVLCQVKKCISPVSDSCMSDYHNAVRIPALESRRIFCHHYYILNDPHHRPKNCSHNPPQS